MSVHSCHFYISIILKINLCCSRFVLTTGQRPVLERAAVIPGNKVVLKKAQKYGNWNQQTINCFIPQFITNGKCFSDIKGQNLIH